MLLRERAWDVMRTDPVTVREGQTLREVALKLRKAMKKEPDKACAVVLSDEGEFRGVVTAWWILLYLERSALEDPLKFKGRGDFEGTFNTILRKGFARSAGEAVERDVPVVKPQDPLSSVLEAMLATRRRWAVVMEGGKVLGVIAAEDLFMQMDLEKAEG